MDMFQSEFVHWTVFVLGLTNLITGLAVFSSCRVMSTSRLTRRLIKVPVYQSFYKVHHILWPIFFGSVFAHMTLAALHAGLPWMH